MTTWEISLAYLTKKHPEAAELLQLLGFFARSGVEEGILQDSTGIKPWMVGSCVATRQLNKEQRDELSFLQSLVSLVWRNVQKIPSAGPSESGDPEDLNHRPDSSDVGEQAASWYAKRSQLEDLDLTKELLRIWIDCLGHLGFVDERDSQGWRDEVDAIPRTHSAETIVVVHDPAKVSFRHGGAFGATTLRGEGRSTISRSKSLRRTTEGDFPLEDADIETNLRDDPDTANVCSTMPEGDGNEYESDDMIFEGMGFEMELE